MTTTASSSVAAWVADHHDDLVAFRRQLHMHPELSYEEHLTTEAIGERLRVAGLEPRVFASGTGLVCDIGPSPRLALRADIDALAMDDDKDVSYRSQVPGVAHACGHDVHSTVVLGAGLYLASQVSSGFEGVRLIFQPAEELVPGGAPGVIDDGGIDGIDAIAGVHCDPRLVVGRLGLRPGPITSAADMVWIELEGPGGHTARPEETVDMVSVVARFISELPVRVRGRLDGAPCKFVFGHVRTGDAPNVIPSHARLGASLRTPNPAVWHFLPDIVDEEVALLADEHGASATVHYTPGVPPVDNDAALIEQVRAAAVDELGADAITEAVQSWGGDDFAWYGQQIPAAYVRLGVRDPEATGPPLDLHAGHFDVDERAIGIGIRTLAALARRF